MSIDDVRLIPVASIGAASQLEPLARAIFGQGQRQPEWFTRKLHRECVVPSRSQLLTQSSDDHDPQAWIGYGLLSRPPSIAPNDRTAGIGVIEMWRGRGLGRRVVQALLRASRNDGAPGLSIPASGPSVPFYTRCGLVPARTTHTLLAWGLGEGPPARPPTAAPWDAPLPGPRRSGWFAEAWLRTPSRATVWCRDGRDRFDVSFEGSAHVAMRWTSADGDAQGPRAWLQSVPRGRPALLHEVPESSTELRALVDDGWDVVQTTVAMQG